MDVSAVNQWKHLIQKHWGRVSSKRRRQIMLDLLCVDCGLKPALLCDFNTPDVACVNNLLQASKQTGLLTNHLKVVTIEMDLLIVNPASFLHVSEFCDLFVDVSGNLSCPQFFSESDSRCFLQKTKDSFNSILEKMEDLDSGRTGSDIHLAIGEERGQCANPSTLFGLFLGYPVVYYYDMSLDTEENCLSMVPLVNFVVKGKLPEQLDHDVKEHVVYSFSVPEQFLSKVEDRVQDWFQKKRESRLWCNVFHQLELDRRVAEEPRICL